MPEYRVTAVSLTYPDSFIDSMYRDDQTSALLSYFQEQTSTKCNQVLLRTILGCVPVCKGTRKAEAALLGTIPADFCESENSRVTEFFLNLLATGAQVWRCKRMMTIKGET